MPVTNVGRISGPLLKANLTRNSDLAFETDLLFIGHTNGKIGVRNDAPTRDLQVSGDAIYRGNLIATNSASVGNIDIDGPTQTVSTLTGPINMIAGSSFQMTELRTDNLAFTNSGIRAYNNDNINIHPGPGTGIFNIPSDLKTYGNIRATGDITFDGNIFIGGDSQDDTLSFEGDIESDLIPDQTGIYNIGQTDQRWGQVNVQAMTGLNDIVVDNTISLAGVRVNLGIENKWYVSTNGTDLLTGNHPNFAFGTIKHALQQLEESTNGPHEVHILPGTYIEEFPLEIPANVTVKGAGIRSVIIKPKVPVRFQDAFLLNDASMVSELTIKDFQYDAVNDKGYAFRFAPNAGIVTKSPYIQNVTVLTQGETRTVDDPRGFDSGDAGKGALVDGSVLDNASPRASMLFNAVTFITPGADGITLKNQARAEIIDCFTYFSDTSIKLLSGSEARIIASASVYGNKGITADGLNTKGYAISHNFAYVGSGKDVENDESLIDQNNETEETNSGRIYYVSQDQGGDFRVGDNFIIDFGKGTTSIAVNDGDLGASTLTVGVAGTTTLIDATKIDVPNFRISNNKIQTLQGGLTISAAGSNNVNLNSNVLMPNVDVTGNVTIGGSAINFGNEAGDTVDFAMDFQQDLLPSQDTQSNIGSSTKRWQNLESTRFSTGSLEVHNNIIQATDTNSDIELRGSGTGKVNLEDIGFKTTITSSQGDLGFGVSGNSLQFVGLSNIEIPKGTTAQDPAEGNAIRYDTSLNEFEMFSTGKIALNGIKDGDRNTAIELNNNKFTFYAGSNNIGEIDGLGNLRVTRFSSQNQFALDNNTVTVGSIGGQAALIANGAGKVVLDTANLEITGGLIENTVVDADITITGTGLKQNRTVQFDTTNGYVGPYGTEAQRNATVPRLGALWFNTDNKELQVYAGAADGWVQSIGVQEVTVTRELANDLNTIYNLILN